MDTSTPLLEASWLAKNLNNPNILVIDASPTEEYVSMHIPGSISASFPKEEYLSYGINTSYGGGVDLFTDPNNSLPFQDGPQDYIQEILQRLGINQDAFVVIYDNGANFLATRFFWTLSYYGHGQMAILDGGLEKWAREGYPLDSKIVFPKKGKFLCRPPEKDIVVDTDYVLEKILDPHTVIADANLSSWYHGGFLAYSRRGHIPRAVNAPFPYYFKEDKTWKDKKDLMDYFQSLSIVPEKEIIVYCGGNPAGSCLYFTLHNLLKFPNVKFYYKSLIGWLSDERDLPVHRYGLENLIRDAEWIKWFAGERIQYLVSNPKVRTIDIRKKESYKEGHIPYAVNIPVEEIFINLGLDSEKWARILGENGIDRNTEVVIYDEIISPYVTLFFWILECLGHKKKSIFNGGLKSWVENGFQTTKSETIIALSKHKFDVAINPTKYEIDPINGEMPVYDTENKNGWDPDIFILCSERDDAVFESKKVKKLKQPFGKEYFDAFGNFKKAGDLSSIFESQQIYKHHKIVCYSNFIEESTFIYFVLNLLGYSNVRIYLPKN